MQKKVKADVPSRPAMCLFTKRRKLAFGSDSSTFLTLISHSGYPVSPHRPICFVQAQNGNVEAFNRGLCGAQKCRGNPCDCPDVDETICSALLVVNCRYVAGALGCVRDRSGYETLNQLRITNYELRKGKSRETRLTICMRRVRADSPTRSRLRQGARPKN